MGTRGAVRVFVDDAVQGRFPPVCAATGSPNDGWTTLHAPAVRRALHPVVWVVGLLAGPAGWAVLFVLSVLDASRTEWLDVELPWTERVHRETVALRRRRARAWAVVAIGLVGGLAVARLGPGGGMPSPSWIAIAGASLAAIGGAATALVATWDLGRRTPAVHLDASRRWATISNVDLAFVAAVERDQARRRSSSSTT